MTHKEQIQKQREAHHRALEKLTGETGYGLQVWRKLRHLERDATRHTVWLCNGEVDQEEADQALDAIKARVEAIIGGPCYLNRDPRGYALKLPEGSPDYGLHRDWSGHQILAPDIG